LIRLYSAPALSSVAKYSIPNVRGWAGSDSRDVGAALPRRAAEEISGSRESEVMIGQVSRDRVGNVLGPRLERRQESYHVPVETDELASKRQVLRRDVVQGGQ
jgi:hypothetical protein